MGNGHLVRVVATTLLLGGSAGAAPDPWAAGSAAPPPASDLPGPTAEHGPAQTPVTLPPVPVFELPVAPAGTHGVLELLVLGRPLLDQDVKVSGYVTWIYDCVTALQRPGQARAKVQRRIDADPTLCERPKFYLGDARDTAPEQSLWVVDVPRPFNKLEVERLPKADRTPATYPDRCEPSPKQPGPFCMPLAVGDYVTLSGKFAVASPHSERNSDGLLVFGSVSSAPPPAKVTRMAAPQVPVPPTTLPPLPTTAMLRPPASPALRAESIKHSNEATRAYGQKDFAKASAEYHEAVVAWAGNTLAWYGSAGAQIGAGDWRGAAASMEKAFELAPTNAMYAMVYGYALYQRAYTDAAAQGTTLGASGPLRADLARAAQLLRYAVKLDDKLWRAHYYLGRIERDLLRPQDAAGEFTRALESAPSDPAPWIALCELYRTWRMPALALAVAEQGTKIVPGAASADVWYVLGMAHDDLHHDAPAIAAFTKVLEADPAHAKARFQRGQVLFRSKKFAEAKRDLEAFVADAPANQFAVAQASKMLLDIAATKRR